MDPEISMLNAAVVRLAQLDTCCHYSFCIDKACQLILCGLQVANAFVVRVAAQKALASQQRSKLITKSLHAELVYNMSGSRHVSCIDPILAIADHSQDV